MAIVRKLLSIFGTISTLLLLPAALHAQLDMNSPPKAWAQAAAANEERIINDDGTFPLRYSVRRVDAKNDVTRDTIESRQGTVARLMLRNGQPLTPSEDAAERQRLNDMLASPKDFLKHHKRDEGARNYSLELLRQMPTAMTFAYTPGQPQKSYLPGPQIVLDFAPDPQYHPPSMVDHALTGLAGRVWIDRKSKCIVRVEGHILKQVDFGWGVVARIFPGGNIEFEQANPGGERWVYSRLRSDLTIRELMVKTVHQKVSMDATEFHLLPSAMDYQGAIHTLIDTPPQGQQASAGPRH